MIKAILFDLDGVLVEARELHYLAFNQALAKFGYTISRDEHLSTYDGLPTNKKLQILTQRKGLPANLYNAIWEEKQNQTRHIIENSIQRDERMVKILKDLKRDGYKLAVCSNSIRETVELMLAKKGLLDQIEALLSNQDVHLSKPHPEVFLRAMIELGVGPKECLIIEDSHHGREAAYASGAYVYGVMNPSDVTYEKIKEHIQQAEDSYERKKIIPKWQDTNLRIVVPMAGSGKSFQQAGYLFPKPLIDIRGKPMIQRVVENINFSGKFIFIVLQEHVEKYNLSYVLKLIAPGCEIVVLDAPTKGALISVLKAEHLFNNEQPMAIINADQIIEWNSNEFFYAMAADECDGGIVTFTATHPKWSFVKLRDDGFIGQVAEKIPISDKATAGVYYFRQGKDFVKYGHRSIDSNITTRGEFYIAPVYNELIGKGKRIRQFFVNFVWSLGTPEDLNTFLTHLENTNKNNI